MLLRSQFKILIKTFNYFLLLQSRIKTLKSENMSFKNVFGAFLQLMLVKANAFCLTNILVPDDRSAKVKT